MSEILSYLLLPLARLIYRSAPSKLRTALGNVGKTMTALEVAIALYAISLRYLPTGEFLGKIELPKPWQSITDPWDLLILLSIVVVVHHAGGKVAMNLKFLLQPTIDKIREDLRPQVREEVTAEVREEVTAEEVTAENTRAIKSWLEEQIRAGKVNSDVELPVFGDNDNGNHSPSENGKEGE